MVHSEKAEESGGINGSTGVYGPHRMQGKWSVTNRKCCPISDSDSGGPFPRAQTLRLGMQRNPGAGRSRDPYLPSSWPQFPAS